MRLKENSTPSLHGTTQSVSYRSLPLYIEESSGIQRTNEPVTFGLPFPRGAVRHPTGLSLRDHHGHLLPLQVQVLARWSDGSLRWALLDSQVTVNAHETAQYELNYADSPVSPAPDSGIEVQWSSESIVVNTGPGVFFLNTAEFKPFDRVIVRGVDILEKTRSRIVLTDEAGREYQPRVRGITAEANGPLRVTLCVQGELGNDQHPSFAEFIARLSFYALSSLVELRFTIRNSQAARHQGGFWDLGDPGSTYFRALSIDAALAADHCPEITWTAQPGQPVIRNACSTFEIYQDSSGGPNWQSTNHLNRFGRVTTSFPGYRTIADGTVIQEGQRATPVVSVHSQEQGISGAIAGFWQNFPKAIETQQNRLRLSLFPQQYSDVYELQGGEQKTHTVYLQFLDEPNHLTEWVHDRLTPRAAPEWYAGSKAFSYLTPRPRGNPDTGCLALADLLIDIAVSGSNTFFDRREVIDEYGWRHFGDLYADHEAVNHKGGKPLVAHYNNQYDVIYGAIMQYTRSGEPRWYQLMTDLAKHVTDIDIYHTQADRSAFNGGLFWHSEHYTDAATATHRAYSAANVGARDPYRCGGGPSNEHNYTTGLLYYYWLTGDTAAYEAVQGLADWVMNMDDGHKGILGRLDRRPTGLCSSTVSRAYHGPGRGCGNSINTLLDAYVLTQRKHYLTKAEQLIRRCIHPHDRIEERNFSDIEHRWSYTVFLQVLGKYLDLKAEEQAIDFMYSYAQASLLHYATWMLQNEVPYKQILDKVEIPTETWPAQDIRKSNVLHFAAKHAPEPLRSALQQKAEFFFTACITDLLSFATATLTRPIVLLMTNAYMHAYCQVHPDETSPRPEGNVDFGQPVTFTPQLYELYKAREKVHTLLEAVRALRLRLAASVGTIGVNLRGDRG